MIIKFVIGSEPIENWDSFVSQLDAYHIDEVLAAKQAAYDRYLGKQQIPLNIRNYEKAPGVS